MQSVRPHPLALLTIDLVHNECGYQVIIGRPRDVHLPTVPPKHPKHSPLPTDAWLQCTDVAGAWWLNLILTYLHTLWTKVNLQAVRRLCLRCLLASKKLAWAHPAS